jgi:hypothetical protein
VDFGLREKGYLLDFQLNNISVGMYDKKLGATGVDH